MSDRPASKRRASEGDAPDPGWSRRLVAEGFGTFALVETVVFIVLLMVAFVYVWRRGALEWK